MKQICCLALAVILTVLPVMSVGAESEQCQGCSDYMTIGEQGRVTYTDGTPLRVRSRPSLSGAILDNMPEGSYFTVTGPATCNDGYAWWQVRSGNGVDGWSAEGDSEYYYMEPMGFANDDSDGSDYVIDQVDSYTEGFSSVDSDDYMYGEEFYNWNGYDLYKVPRPELSGLFWSIMWS